MAIAEVEPNEYGDFPANIEFMPGERRINHSGSNLAGVKKTLDEMIDNDHALIPTLIDDEDEKYVVDGAEACSLGPEGQAVRWWKRPKEWIKTQKRDNKSCRSDSCCCRNNCNSDCCNFRCTSSYKRKKN